MDSFKQTIDIDTEEPEISPFLFHTFFSLYKPVAYIAHNAT